ncbi:hypothetical protein [Brassicibacter mesophilus]|uniref:hypothetical protein n=1 Tax=Brassicibacter mesophilus TaxID=745119 RepID=UPI003D248D8F
MTPYQLNLAVQEYAKKKESESKESIYQAYLISRWVWQKKIDIEKILEIKREKKVMTDKQMIEQAKVLNAMFGGKVKT